MCTHLFIHIRKHDDRVYCHDDTPHTLTNPNVRKNSKNIRPHGAFEGIVFGGSLVFYPCLCGIHVVDLILYFYHEWCVRICIGTHGEWCPTLGPVVLLGEFPTRRSRGIPISIRGIASPPPTCPCTLCSLSSPLFGPNSHLVLVVVPAGG